ncbi:MAG: hypothetical protein A2Z14_10765 [Chloroflexi bacterium RBG_16_48_8]|nr:MAG: hypothetical protein A2Z14_10765 [Chloroflexi bacterium RBG_16_48_8]
MASVEPYAGVSQRSERNLAWIYALSKVHSKEALFFFRNQMEKERFSVLIWQEHAFPEGIFSQSHPVS